jgi:hypothetical protein
MVIIFIPKQDSEISAIANGTFMADPFSTQGDNLQIVSAYSGFLYPRKGPPDHANPSDNDVVWLNKTGRPLSNEGFFLQPSQKRSRNIGSKSRRLCIDSEDVLELKLTWEEAQDLLRPPPSVKPNVVRIEDYEFEEYDVSGVLFLFDQKKGSPFQQDYRSDMGALHFREVDDLLSK